MNAALVTPVNQTVQQVTIGADRIDQLLTAFIGDQDVRDSSRGLYTRTLNQFFKWVSSTGRTLSQVLRNDIISYKEDLLNGGLSPLTVGSYITVVRKFYEWAEGKGYYFNIAKGVKTPKRKQQFKKEPISGQQSKALLNYYQGQAARDYAMINLMLRTGLRTIEVVRADVGDITFKHGKRVLMVHGKGRDSKDEFVILTDKAFTPIQEYLKTRGKVKSNEPLFRAVSNRSTGRLTTRAVSGIAKEGLRAIGIDSRSVTAHSLRHTTAVEILRAGGSLEQTQGVLRHASPNTTQIYTESIKEEMRIKHAPEELLDTVY